MNKNIYVHSYMIDCESYIYAYTQVYKQTWVSIHMFIHTYAYIHIHSYIWLTVDHDWEILAGLHATGGSNNHEVLCHHCCKPQELFFLHTHTHKYTHSHTHTYMHTYTYTYIFIKACAITAANCRNSFSCTHTQLSTYTYMHTHT